MLVVWRVRRRVRWVPAGSQGRDSVLLHVGDQIGQGEGGVGVDGARCGSLHADVGQLCQVILHIGVMGEGRGGGVWGEAQGVSGGVLGDT